MNSPISVETQKINNKDSNCILPSLVIIAVSIIVIAIILISFLYSFMLILLRDHSTKWGADCCLYACICCSCCHNDND